jgi:hypothetical protein
MLKDTDNSDDALMIAMLNYGAAAQKYFEYRLDDLVNSQLSEEQKTMSWDGSLVRSDWNVPEEKAGELVRSDKITSRGAYLTLEGAIDYNYYIKVAAGVEVKSIKLLTWTEEVYKSLDVLTVGNAENAFEMVWDATKGRYEYCYEGLPAKDMFGAVYACAMVEDMNGNIYYGGVVPYCPERFSSINANSSEQKDADLARWIVIYGDAAREYFK